MPRDLPIGNGNILIAFDHEAMLREFYFPHVGEESHTLGHPWRFGVWMDGSFDWLPGNGWRLSRDYLDDTLATQVVFTHAARRLRITVQDLVDFHENAYLKKITVENRADRPREVRLFLGIDFCISGNPIGDTAAFRPENGGLLHYKGERCFLVNLLANNKFGIRNFAAGNKGVPGQEGTWRDAEDGVLSGNPIAQGAVDSVAGVHLTPDAGAAATLYFWVAAGKSWREVQDLDERIRKRGPESFIRRTADYWKLWADKERPDLGPLPAKLARLYRRSLLIARTQIDNGGAIIAANDSDVVQFNRDTYSYMWPRDAALTAAAFDQAGYPEISSRLFALCATLIEREGFFQHKFTPAGQPGSSWHPWLKDGRRQLPVQEDETALVLWALWRHFRRYRDVETIKPLYKPLIKAAADFMMNYRDTQTGLPVPSYDLWEERHGILSFTAGAVYGGLKAAAAFTAAFGETELAASYEAGAGQLRTAMAEHLYLPQEKRFCRMLNFTRNGEKEVDAAVDASLWGVTAFGAFAPDDERVASTMRQVRERLWCPSAIGGLARYEDDAYYRSTSAMPGNPWFVTTLWLAQHTIAICRNRAELEAQALPLLEWVCDHALPSGVLAEQVDPHTGAPLSVSPLTWSHATLIAAVQDYLGKLRELEKCPACGSPPQMNP